MRISKSSLLIIIPLLAGLFLKGLFLVRYSSGLNSDEAVVGLISLDIIHGYKFPLFFYGQKYFGPFESLVAIPFIWVIGINPAALRLSIVFISVMMAFAAWKGAARIYSANAAGFVFAWLAMPPLIMTVWSVIPSGGHMGGLLIGSLVFMQTAQIIAREKVRGVDYFLLGLTAGFGLWMYPALLIFLAAAGASLLLADYRKLFSPKIAFAFAGVIIGGLPFWIYTWKSRLANFNFGQSDPTPFKQLVSSAWGVVKSVPELLGADQLGVAGFFFVAGVAAILIYSLPLLFKRGLSAKPSAILVFGWLVILLDILAYAMTRADRYGELQPRYLFPALWGMSLVFGYVVDQAKGMAKRISAGGLTILFAMNIAAIATGYKNKSCLKWDTRLGDTLVWAGPYDFMKSQNISRAYFDSHIYHTPIMYLSDKNLIGVSIYDDRHEGYSPLVDMDDNPAYIFSFQNIAREFEWILKSLRLNYSHHRIENFDIYNGIKPAFDYGFSPVPKERMRMRSQLAEGEAKFALDGNMATAWDSGKPQAGDEEILIDLGAETEITRLDLIADSYTNIPAALQIESSTDGKSWRELAKVSLGSTAYINGPKVAFKVWEGFNQFIFEPVKARYLRVKQTGKGNDSWRINEIFVYAPASEVMDDAKQNWDETVKYLSANNVSRIISDFYFSANVAERSKNITANQRYNSRYPDNKLATWKFGIDELFSIAVYQRNYGEIKGFLDSQKITAKIAKLGGYYVFHDLSAPASRLKPIEGERPALYASHHQAEAGLMADGDNKTYWPGGLAENQDGWIVADMGKNVRAAGVELVAHGAILSAPAKLEIYHSPDKIKWTRAEGQARIYKNVHWTGSHLIGDSQNLSYIFNAAEARYWKVVYGGEADLRWNIGEMKFLAE